MLTPPLLFADYAEYVDVSDRSEIRFRATKQLTATPIAPPAAGIVTPTPAPAGGTATTTIAPLDTGLDFFTQPQLHIRMTDLRLQLDFSYQPSLTLTDVELGTGLQQQVLNAGTAGAGWRADRHVTLGVTEDATYGRFNSGTLLPVPGTNAATGGSGAQGQTGGTGTGTTGTGTTGTGTAGTTPMTGTNPSALQPKPGPQTVTLVTTRTAATLAIEASRRTHVTMGAAYFATGGVGTDSQTVLPLQYGPSADASLTYALSRRDLSITTAHGYSTQFVGVQCIGLRDVALNGRTFCRPHDDFAEIMQGFRHNFERTTSAEAEVGVAFVRARNDDDQPDRSVWLPSARLTLDHREVPKGAKEAQATNQPQAAYETQAIAQLVPLINPFTGGVINFLQAQAILTEPLAPTVVLRATGGAGQAIPSDSPSSSTIIQGEVEVDFAVARQVILSVGERAFWQRQPLTPNQANMAAVATVASANAPVVFADFFSTVTYFAVTVRAPELRF